MNCMANPIPSMYGAGLARNDKISADIIPALSPYNFLKLSGIEMFPLVRIFGATQNAYINAKT